MGKIIGCAIVVTDDFENILILKIKVKRGEKEAWSLISAELKGKETMEKCLAKAVKNTIKSLVFDLEEYKEFVVNKETKDTYVVYKGNIKEKPMLDKKYMDTMWIGRRNIHEYNLLDYEKDILEDILV